MYMYLKLMDLLEWWSKVEIIKEVRISHEYSHINITLIYITIFHFLV